MLYFIRHYNTRGNFRRIPPLCPAPGPRAVPRSGSLQTGEVYGAHTPSLCVCAVWWRTPTLCWYEVCLKWDANVYRKGCQQIWVHYRTGISSNIFGDLCFYQLLTDFYEFIDWLLHGKYINNTQTSVG